VSKHYLLILDDVWDAKHVEELSTAFDSSRSHLLITSRRADLADTLAANELHIDVLSQEASLALLAKTAGVPAANLPREARSVSIECGGLPLALAVCGAMARNGISWASLWDALREA